MALADLRNVDPFGPAVEAQGRFYAERNRALQQAFDRITQGISLSRQRRDNLREQERAFRDREYALISDNTNKLVQPNTSSSITDVQIQELGTQMKKEYYAAVKEYEQSDKGDEARQKFQEAKQAALTSARTVSGAIENLGAQAESFRQLYNSGGVSAAVNPAVREFMIDIIDPATPADKYQIVQDPDTGEYKYIDTETGGEKINFFLSEVANGENHFAPIAKIDMPEMYMKLMNGVSRTKKQIENEFGIAEVTDWDAIGTAIDGRMDNLLSDQNTFKAIAAEEGFGWDAFDIVSRYEQTGEPYVDIDGTEYTSIDQIKEAVKQDIMDKIESITPHEENQVYTRPEHRQPTLAQQAQLEENVANQQQLNRSITEAAGKKDVDFFKNQILGRVKGIDNVVFKDGKLILVSGFGSKASPEQVYDLSNISDLGRLTELMGGNRDLYASAERASNFKSQL